MVQPTLENSIQRGQTWTSLCDLSDHIVVLTRGHPAVNLAIVGSRDFQDLRQVETFLSNLHDLVQDDPGRWSVISGGAKGVDSVAETVARELHFAVRIFPADWERLGKRAGFVRNRQIIDSADVCVAFWDGRSKGTKHSVQISLQKGIPVFLVNSAGKSCDLSRPTNKTAK